MKEMIEEKKQMFGEIFVKWNIREIDGDEAMFRFSKLFHTIFLESWQKHIKTKKVKN